MCSWNGKRAGCRADAVMYYCILLGGLGGGVGGQGNLPPEPFLLHVTMSFLSLVTKGQDRLKVITLLALWDSRPKSETNVFSNFRSLAFWGRGCFLCSKEFWICSHHAPPLQSTLLLSTLPPISPKSFAKNFHSRLGSPLSLFLAVFELLAGL